MTTPSPRISPAPPESWTEAVKAILTAGQGDQPPLSHWNIFTTLAWHPDLMRAWMPFADFLLYEGALPFTDRELVILRTGHNCRANYEWGHHVMIARDGGVERELIDRVKRGPEAEGWDLRQAAMLRATDELHSEARISDDTWNSLAEHLSKPELVELPILVGQYHLVCFFLSSLEIELEPGLEPLEA